MSSDSGARREGDAFVLAHCVDSEGRKRLEFLMFLARQGRVPGSLGDCSSRCCCGEQDPGLPSDAGLFCADLTLGEHGYCFLLEWLIKWRKQMLAASPPSPESV